MVHRIGFISDTHGLLRPDAVEALQGVEHIIHAGDVGAPDILDELRNIAPLTAVRGNVDNQLGVNQLPDTDVFAVEGISIYVLHNLADLQIDPAAAGLKVVVYGHSHQVSVHEKGGVIYANPGSAGPKRFNLKPSLAVMEIEGYEIEIKIVELQT
jgi:uncharacterized protein